MENNFQGTKVCGRCGKRIPILASKCPYCHSQPDEWLYHMGWWTDFWLHPFWSSTIGIIVNIAFWLFVCWMTYYAFFNWL